MLVNVRITVERMDMPGVCGRAVTVNIPLPQDLMARKGDVRLMTKIARTILGAFARAYMKACE